MVTAVLWARGAIFDIEYEAFQGYLGWSDNAQELAEDTIPPVWELGLQAGAAIIGFSVPWGLVRVAGWVVEGFMNS